jgi:CRP/FNR family transcriptional regulator, anaerobic regulatory protein
MEPMSLYAAMDTNEFERGNPEQGQCEKFTFKSGAGAQPKTNHCTNCAAHKLALCSRLDGSDLDNFGALSQHKSFSAGQTLFSEYDDARYFYTVISGDVRLSRMLDDGRRQITGFKSTGDFIGLGTNGHFSADAEAINEVIVCQFSIPNLNQSLEKYVEVQGQLMQMMQQEVIALQDHMLLLGRKTPIEKIANFLCERAKKQAIFDGLEELPDTVEITLPMSRTDVADFLGLTIETVSRTITKLRKSGVIKLITSQHIHVQDVEQLLLLAEGES